MASFATNQVVNAVQVVARIKKYYVVDGYVVLTVLPSTLKLPTMAANITLEQVKNFAPVKFTRRTQIIIFNVRLFIFTCYCFLLIILG